MNDALLGADPAQLAIGHEISPCRAHISGQFSKGFVHKARGNVSCCLADEIVAPADGEGEAVAAQ